MATQKTLYLTTDGIYHTNEELAQEAQEQLNSTGGKSEAIEDLDAFLAQATTNSDSKYWGELYAQAISTTSKFRSTDSVNMFKDIFDKDFDLMVNLALSIAAHRYTLPVSVDWQTEDDKAKAHLNGDNFNYTLVEDGGIILLLSWNDKGFLYSMKNPPYSITTEPGENTFGFRSGLDGAGDLLATFTYNAETESFNPFEVEKSTYRLNFTSKSRMLADGKAAVINYEAG